MLCVVVAQQKTCTRCRMMKPLDCYTKQSKGKYGRSAECKECRRVSFSEWRRRKISEFVPANVPDSKYCPICLQDRPSSAFTRDKSRIDGLHAYCRACSSSRILEARRSFKQKINQIKESRSCADCGNSYRYWVMQFDHLPGSQKLLQISNGLSSGMGGMRAVLRELEKCEVVCANCHATRTFNRQGSEA